MFTWLLLSSVLTANCTPRQFRYASKISRILSTPWKTFPFDEIFKTHGNVQIFVIADNRKGKNGKKTEGAQKHMMQTRKCNKNIDAKK